MHSALPNSLLYHETHELSPDRDWVVMVHGAGGSVRTWKYQLEAFQKEYNVLLMDLRDHGDSQDMLAPANGKYTFALMAEDVNRLMEHLGIEKAHLLGVSMGSVVVRWFEKLFPEKVQSMLFAGGVFRLNFKLKMGLKVGLLLARVFSFRILSRVLSFLIMPRGNHQRARNIFLREADRIDQDAYRKWLGIAGGIGVELEMFFRRKVTVPTLAVMGSQDHVFLPPARDFDRMNPLMNLKIIPDCGHVCNIESSVAFNTFALSFLRKLPAVSLDPPEISKNVLVSES